MQWGVPFACFVVFGPLLYDLAMHKPYNPRTLPWPALDIAFDFVLSTSVFGYLTGEGSWRKHERDYNHSTR